MSWPAFNWVQYLFPYSFYSRLVISNEFEECLELTPQEEHTRNCYVAISNTIATSLDGTYSDASVFRLAQAGIYKGARNIEEYQLFFSGVEDPNAAIWNNCPAENGQGFARLNHANATHCDVTVSTILRGRFNPGKTLDVFLNESLISYSFGQRMLFSYSSELSSVEILKHDVYYPKRFIHLTAEYGSGAKQALDVCRIMDTHCPNVTAANGFTSIEDCVSKLVTLPKATINAHGIATVDGNSVGCRTLHASLVVKDDKHCPHLSYIPMVDRDGKYKCQLQGENNMTPSAIFSEEDLSLFEHNGISSGLGKDQVKLFRNDDEDFPKCFDGATSDLLEASVYQDPSLPTSIYCIQYLVSRDATGEQNVYYWLALLVMFLVLRSIAFGLLHLRASRFSG